MPVAPTIWEPTTTTWEPVTYDYYNYNPTPTFEPYNLAPVAPSPVQPYDGYNYSNDYYNNGYYNSNPIS